MGGLWYLEAYTVPRMPAAGLYTDNAETSFHDFKQRQVSRVVDGARLLPPFLLAQQTNTIGSRRAMSSCIESFQVRRDGARARTCGPPRDGEAP